MVNIFWKKLVLTLVNIDSMLISSLTTLWLLEDNNEYDQYCFWVSTCKCSYNVRLILGSNMHSL